MKLNKEIIESYGFEKKTIRPDWDDMGYEITLSNDIVVTSLFVCNNEPCEMDCLEGVDGYVYIDTKEDLDIFLSKTGEEVLNEIKEEYKDFDIDEWM